MQGVRGGKDLTFLQGRCCSVSVQSKPHFSTGQRKDTRPSHQHHQPGQNLPQTQLGAAGRPPSHGPCKVCLICTTYLIQIFMCPSEENNIPALTHAGYHCCLKHAASEHRVARSSGANGSLAPDGWNRGKMLIFFF